MHRIRRKQGWYDIKWWNVCRTSMRVLRPRLRHYSPTASRPACSCPSRDCPTTFTGGEPARGTMLLDTAVTWWWTRDLLHWFPFVCHIDGILPVYLAKSFEDDYLLATSPVHDTADSKQSCLCAWPVHTFNCDAVPVSTAEVASWQHWPGVSRHARHLNIGRFKDCVVVGKLFVWCAWIDASVAKPTYSGFTHDNCIQG